MKTVIVFISNTRLRGLKPSNEFNYLLVDGKPVWYHLSLLFSRENPIYFFLDKRLKGQPKLENVSIELKSLTRDLLISIYEKHRPDKLVIIDDSLIFNVPLAQEIQQTMDNGIFFSPACSVDKLSICGIINKGRIQNLTYGINKQENGIYQSGNIYVLSSQMLSTFFEKYNDVKFVNYVLFEMFNALIVDKHNLTAFINPDFKLLSIKNIYDLEGVKRIIHENISHYNQR